MKNVKRMLVLLIMVLVGAFVLTACGKVEEPTLAEVEEALRDEGYIKDGKKSDKKDDEDKDEDKDDDKDDDDDDKDKDDDKDDEDDDDKDKDDDKDSDEKSSPEGYSYEVKIDKCKLNDDKDKATVDATLVEKNGSLTITTEFEIVFKYNKDKKSWKTKSVEVDGEPKAELSAGIDNKTAETLVMSRSYSATDDIYIYSDELTEAKADDASDLNAEDMTDKKTVHVKAETKRNVYEFDVEAKFQFSYYNEKAEWYITDANVKNLKSEISDNFKLVITKEDIEKEIKNADRSIYVLGDSYKTSEDVVKIENVKFEEPDLTNAYYSADVPVEYDAVIGGKVTVHYTANASYSFDDKWMFSYLGSVEQQETTFDVAESWSGYMNRKDDYAGDKVVINITNDTDEDGYPIAKVKVTPTNTEKPAYSFTGRMTTISFHEDKPTYKLSFVEFDGERPTGVYSTSFYGEIKDGKWVPTSSYDNFEFKLSDGSEPADPEPTATPTPDPGSSDVTAATEAKGGNIVGAWDINKDVQGIKVGIEFREDGSISIVEDLSAMMHFKTDGALYVKSAGMEIPANYTTCDASGLKVSIEGQDMLVFQRLDSNTGFDGKYKITGGALLDGLLGSVANGSITADNFEVEVKGETMIMKISGLMSYKTEGSKLSITGDAAAFNLSDFGGDCEYTVENDVLTIFENGGGTVACKRF